MFIIKLYWEFSVYGWGKTWETSKPYLDVIFIRRFTYTSFKIQKQAFCLKTIFTKFIAKASFSSCKLATNQTACLFVSVIYQPFWYISHM